MLSFLIIGIILGFLLGSHFKEHKPTNSSSSAPTPPIDKPPVGNNLFLSKPLISVIFDQFLGCNQANLCPCCQNTRVMFLPDESPPCKSFYSGLMNAQPQGCTFEDDQNKYKNRYRPKMPCKYNHGRPNEPPSALVELFKVLDSAQESIYICMYLIKLNDIIKFLIYLKESRDIKIQIVTNSKWDSKEVPKREMKQLHQAGIEIKTNDEGMMHNKFVIVDRKTVISGSINWTYTAFRNNDETIMITSQWGIVERFLKKFEQMWEQMNLLQTPNFTVTQANPVCFLATISGAESDDQSSLVRKRNVSLADESDLDQFRTPRNQFIRTINFVKNERITPFRRPMAQMDTPVASSYEDLFQSSESADVSSEDEEVKKDQKEKKEEEKKIEAVEKLKEQVKKIEEEKAKKLAEQNDRIMSLVKGVQPTKGPIWC